MPIAVHVFGGTMGESIVVEFPDGTCGVIDCHTQSGTNLEKNPVCCFLSQRRIKQLDFVCLTHPHDDHFSGLQ